MGCSTYCIIGCSTYCIIGCSTYCVIGCSTYCMAGCCAMGCGSIIGCCCCIIIGCCITIGCCCIIGCCIGGGCIGACCIICAHALASEMHICPGSLRTGTRGSACFLRFTRACANACRYSEKEAEAKTRSRESSATLASYALAHGVLAATPGRHSMVHPAAKATACRPILVL